MRFLRLTILMLPVIIFISCTTEHSKLIVADYGDYKITMDEFEKAYAKNTGGPEKAKNDSIAEYKKFLDLYVNYKMKLRDAVVRGFLKDIDLNQEYVDYKANIGTTLFLEKEFYEPNMRLMYERRKDEYRASHILLMEDSVTTKAKIDSIANVIMGRVNKGEDFAKLVQEYSRDERTKNSGGDVYYFTVGQVTIPAIEDAILSLEPGQVFSKPVFSGFGYHILKVTEKQPRRSKVKASHILIMMADSTGKVDSVKALQQIQDIEKQLKNGADFGELALKYSQDNGSAKMKGDLGLFERGRMIKEFDEMAFKLNVGEISPIVKTRYGYHIIKVTEIPPYPTYEEEKEELRGAFQRTRYKLEYDKLVERLKKELNLTMKDGIIEKIISNPDTIKLNSPNLAQSLKNNLGKEVVFAINQKPFTVDSLFKFLEGRANFAGSVIDKQLLTNGTNEYASDRVVREKALIYDKVNSEFAILMDEYKNGMYLFKILEEEVWTKLTIDSTKTKNFWEKNKDKYSWGNRVEFKEIYVYQDSIKNEIVKGLAQGITFDSLYTKYNNRSGYENKPGYNGLVDVNINELAKQANKLEKPGDLSHPFKFEDGWSIVKLIKKEEPGLKTYDEAKAEAGSALQEFESKRLESEYVDKLKRIYEPNYYYEELKKAFKL